MYLKKRHSAPIECRLILRMIDPTVVRDVAADADDVTQAALCTATIDWFRSA